MRRLIIHVGPIKTGTSAIQYGLLASANGPFCYPKVGLWSDGSHHNLVHSFFPHMTHPAARPIPLAETIQELRNEAARSGMDILISSEALSEEKVRHFVDQLTHFLGDVVTEVILVMVVREHLERSASVYNQFVKDSFYGEHRAPDDFLVALAGTLTYWPLASALKATGHRVVAVNYHGSRDLVGRFVTELGGDPTKLPGPVRRNVSMSMKGLIAMLEINRRYGPRDRDRYFTALRQMRGFFSGGAFPFSVAGVQRARPVFQADSELLALEFGIELPSRSLLPFDGGLLINAGEFDDIKLALHRAQISDSELIAAIEPYVRPK